jgi:hypothetical protein
MKTWNLEINIMVTPNLSEEEIVAILQTELDHPDIEFLVVSKIKEEKENRFLRGFSLIKNNFTWWSYHIDATPRAWNDDTFFWNLLSN